MSAKGDDDSKENVPQFVEIRRERRRSTTESTSSGLRFEETGKDGNGPERQVLGESAGGDVGMLRRASLPSLGMRKPSLPSLEARRSSLQAQRPSLSLLTPPATATRQISNQLLPDTSRLRRGSPAGLSSSTEESTSSSSESEASLTPRGALTAAIADEVDAEVEGRRLSIESTSGPRRRSSLFSAAPKARRTSTMAQQIARVMSASKVAALLNGFPFFKDFEAGVVRSLSHVVTQAMYKAGTVLFCQGDPPGNCYVVVEGSVAVFYQHKEETPVAEESNRASMMARRTTRRSSTVPSLEDPPPAANFQRRTSWRRSSNTGMYDDSVNPLEVLATRVPTVEGFSLYHPDMDLGEQVATLPAGSITGEIALLHEQPRSASLKCAVDTCFIIINKADFQTTLKAEMQRAREEKLNFLLEHLPGLRGVPVARPGGRPHPSYYFKKTTVAKGHEFLKQGQTMDVPCLYIVLQGTVEIRRTELSTHLNDLSKSEASRRKLTSSMTRKRPNSAMFRGAATPLRGGDGQGLSRISRHIGTLQVGSLFGSVALAEEEPFTLLASSGVEVFSVTTDVMRFPMKLMRAVQEYLTQAMTYRLQRLKVCRASDVMKQHGQFAHKPEARSGANNDIGLSLLLNGTLGTTKSKSQPALANSPSAFRPQSAPAEGRLTSGKTRQTGGTSAGQWRSGSIPPPGTPGCANGLAEAETLLGRGALSAARRKRPTSAAVI